MKTIKFTVKLLPCPFCGLAELEVGVQSCQTYGVKCPQCRALVERTVPDKWPRGVWKRDLSMDKNVERLHRWTLGLAIKIWNERSAADKATKVKAYIIA